MTAAATRLYAAREPAACAIGVAKGAPRTSVMSAVLALSAVGLDVLALDQD